MRPARARRWTPPAALFLLAAVVPPSTECDPAYLVMSPDGWVFPSITVTMTDRHGKPYIQETHFPSAARCSEAERMLRSIADRLAQTITIKTTLCDPQPYEGR